MSTTQQQPPAYTEDTKNPSATKRPILATYNRHKSRRSKTGQVLLAEIEVYAQEPLLLATDATFQDLLTLCTERAVVKNVIPKIEPGCRPWRTAFIKPDRGVFVQNVRIDEENWEAGREMLFDRAGASLVFGITVVRDGEERGKGRCVMQ